jgi:integrase/recombinase XerD
MSNNPPSTCPHLHRFLESLRVRGYSSATVSSRHESLQLFLRWLREEVGTEDVREVTRQTIRDYQEWLLARYATSSAHVHLIALRRFFEHLEATDLILINPCVGLVLPKLEDRLPRNVLTPEEATKILNTPDPETSLGIRDRAILELFYSTGIRLEEMARLTVQDVDTQNGFVRVTKGKFAKDRVVPMGAKACACVREYLDSVRRHWGHREERALWLSVRKPHGVIHHQMIAVMVREYGKTAGIEKRVSPHVWRHTCATHLLNRSGNLVYVQRLLGHRSLGTTQRYTRVSIGDVKQTHTKAHPRSRA